MYIRYQDDWRDINETFILRWNFYLYNHVACGVDSWAYMLLRPRSVVKQRDVRFQAKLRVISYLNSHVLWGTSWAHSTKSTEFMYSIPHSSQALRGQWLLMTAVYIWQRYTHSIKAFISR